MGNDNNKLQVILDIALALSGQKNRNRLFDMIITKSMELSKCDAGTLYLCENNTLVFRIMKTLSQGVDKGADGKPIDIPPVPYKEENICAYCAINQVALNIPDVYNSDQFDFSGPKRYDSMTGYHTGSMMAIPLVNDDGDTVGVLQLMNAKDENGEIIPFDKEIETEIHALASLTAIAVTNMRYSEELKEQMWSFTEAMAAAIDAKTPYNASHTRNVAKYCGMLADHINGLFLNGKEDEYFSENRKEQLVMGAFLHDIGKIVTPLEVMNKATRLGGKEADIEKRFDSYKLMLRINQLENKITDEEYDEAVARVEEAREVMNAVNGAGFVNDELGARLAKVLDYTLEYQGETKAFFTEEEKSDLKVVKGTLTPDERQIMEDHVKMTERILDKVHFNTYFKDSPTWAIQHHECLNGKGYPRKLTADDLKAESRIIAVADICDALLATDRPYKKPLPKEKAFDIMRGMAKDGNIEAKYVEYLYECIDVE